MSDSALFYGLGVAALFILSTAVSNVPSLSFSTYFEFVYRTYVCLGLYGLGTLMGIYTLFRFNQRKDQPWKVPQSAVFLPYMVFFFSFLIAILLTR
jgi:hypothetical protein